MNELLGARTPAAADSALAGLQGGVGGAVAALRTKCLDVLAELEARCVTACACTCVKGLRLVYGK